MKTLSKILFFCLLLGIFQPSVAQEGNTELKATVETFTQQLKAEGANLIFYVDQFCLGKTEIFKVRNNQNCIVSPTYHSYYVFWQKGNEQYLQRIDKCGRFQKIPLEDNEIFETVSMNMTNLKNETILPYKKQRPDTGPTSSTETYPCRRNYKFIKENSSFERQFMLYDISSMEDNPNMNYEHNQGLSIVQLENMLDEFIEEIQNDFIRL
ncbi:hypothetical protein [Luteirhabdus pelagi]|uniref:hypothetical protein n=1 Tax=Luteirhabdus pelagi TaxID=2792783 RepID=UPI001939990B|nr:hypothetical protein [Luteirhabdus pelagi]